MRTTYVPGVDALRCLAMSAVVMYHCGLLPIGWMGVWLFFVVSGFAITTSLIASEKVSDGKSTLLRNFYLRRTLRIWPLYFGFITLNYFVIYLAADTAPFQLLPWLATFTYNFVNLFGPTDPAVHAWRAFWPLWTLSVEEQFYILFPLLFALLSGGRRVIAVAALVAMAPLARAAISAYVASLGWAGERAADAIYKFSPGHFDGFAAGALIALLRDTLEQRRNWSRAFLAATVGLAVLYVGTYGGMAVAADGGVSVDTFRNIVSGVLYGQGREIALYTVICAASAWLIWAVIVNEHVVGPLTGSSMLRSIGKVSFGAYLFHVPVILLVELLIPWLSEANNQTPKIVTGMFKLTLAYPLTVALAMASFHWFEQPITRLRSRFP